MATLAAILSEKGSQILATSAGTSVRDAAVLMNEHRVGALVVKEDDRMVGIFTERDVLRRVVAERRDPAATSVGEVMTTDVVCAPESTSIEEARAIMRQCRVRHLPVFGAAGNLAGVVSIGDLNAWQLDGQERAIHHLHEYLYGRV